MALNAFQFTGGANINNVGTTPVGVQVAGPTINITNISKDVTVYGSLGGSGTLAGFNPAGFLSGASLGSIAGLFGNTGVGVCGFAVPPLTSLAVAVGGNSYLWLATLAGEGAVNVANGT